MTRDTCSTAPVRCESCGQPTHKTLEALLQNGGLLCGCGAFTKVDVAEFAKEIKKSEADIEDFGRDG
jgi:hypothetical protein